MSYAMVQGYGRPYRGFGDAGDPMTAPLATPDDTYNSVLAGAPTADQVQAEWGPSVDAAAKFSVPFDQMTSDPNQAVNFMVGALQPTLQAAGLQLPPIDVMSLAQGIMTGHSGPAVAAAIKTGAAYGLSELGISPQVGTMTVDAIVDIVQNGEITDKAVEAIGGMAGSVAGSSLLAFIGVPPCIGGYIGGFVGTLVGKALASVFHLGGGKAEREEKKKEWDATVSAFSGELAQVRQQYVNLLIAKRGEWWATWDHIIDNLALQWSSLECQPTSGYTKFPLLWTGAGDASPYFLHPLNAAVCNLPINQNLSRGTGCLNTGAYLSNVTASGCTEPYGCLYPQFPTIGESDDCSERVVQAFAAFDIWWVPESGRAAIDQMWANSFSQPNALPTDPTIRKHQQNMSWVNWMATMQTSSKNICQSNACKNMYTSEIQKTLVRYQADLSQTASDALSNVGIQAATARIASDITASAAIYAAAAKINSQRSALISGNLSRAISAQANDQKLIIQKNQQLKSAIRYGNIKNDMLNYAMLAAGGGLLGAALLKGRRA